MNDFIIPPFMRTNIGCNNCKYPRYNNYLNEKCCKLNRQFETTKKEDIVKKKFKE